MREFQKPWRKYCIECFSRVYEEFKERLLKIMKEQFGKFPALHAAIEYVEVYISYSFTP